MRDTSEIKKNIIYLYFQLLTQLFVNPGRFFSHQFNASGPDDTDWQGQREIPMAIPFFLVSCIVFTGGSVAGHGVGFFSFEGGIFFANAFGMSLLSAVMGYIIIHMILGQTIPFRVIVGIYACSCGLTLLFSWVPFFFWFTEPWKWWVTGLGLMKVCHLTFKQALITIVLSIMFIVMLFKSLMLIMV